MSKTPSYMDTLRRKNLDDAQNALTRAARTLAAARELAVEVAVHSNVAADVERANALHEAAQNALHALAAHRRSPEPAAPPELLTVDQVDDLLQQGYETALFMQDADLEAMGWNDDRDGVGQWAPGQYALGGGRVLTVLFGGNGVLDTLPQGV